MKNFRRELCVFFKKALQDYNVKFRGYDAVKGNDDNERRSHMLTLANDVTVATNTPAKSAHKQLLHIEQQQKSNQRVKIAIKTNSKTGVARVLIPARLHYGDAPDYFIHYDVNYIWAVIYPHNDKDINVWERIIEKSEVE